MKFLVFLAILGLALAQRRPGAPAHAPQKHDDVVIVRSEHENNGDGTYRFLWETSDGSKHEESGYLKPNGNEAPIQVAQGAYEYYSPEGEHIQLTYVADENGFQPQGAHLPTPPPIPAEIQKALDIIYAGIAKGPAAPVQTKHTPLRPTKTGRPGQRKF